MPKVLNPNESYTFSKYFDLPYSPEDILADLGCTLERSDRNNLPYTQWELDWLPALATSIRRRLKRVNTTTAQARREALIFPLLDQICDRLDYSINIEYTVSVSNWLKGSLDYYIPSPNNLLVIEAKQADLTKGFTQLAVELIALDRWVESESPILYGAVSTGEIWRFGLYDRSAHHIVEYLPLHPIPQDLEFVTRTLIGILQGEALKDHALLS
ncbi:MAG TPA: hypothetical protein DCL61_07400 [Cyanobacteria bacterium UBA12227]|nr:hypothetical protein [Cyanobacteria bacterium UBA12227]HAX85254.1 hypothetical protein [Cyanobacteria bacterium UBA11370]